MSRRDPQATTGQPYEPPCVCGHPAVVHSLVGRRRWRCSNATTVGECACREYRGDELAGGGHGQQ